MTKIAFFENPHSKLIKQYVKDSFTIYTNESDIEYDYSKLLRAQFFAHQNVDEIFDKYYKNSLSIRFLDKFTTMHKKALLLHLAEIYTMHAKIAQLGATHFIPKSDYHLHESSPILHNVKIIPQNNIKDKIWNLLLFLHPNYIIFKKFKGVWKKNRQHYKVGLTIDHGKKMKFLNFCTEDYLIDDKELPKENVLFIDERGDLNKADYEKLGYNHYDFINKREFFSPKLFIKLLKKFWQWKTVFWVSIFDPPWLIETNRKIFSDYVKWSIFLDNYKIDNYVKRLLPDNISKIELLKERGVKTWLVYPDNMVLDAHINWKGKHQTIFTHINYDNVVVHGEHDAKFFRDYKNNANFIKVGILYSQIVAELESGKLKSPINTKKLPHKIIGIFDTGYSNSYALKPTDGIKFAEDTLKLIGDFPEYGFIFKAKNSITHHKFLIPFYQRIRHHPRCLFFYRHDGTGISAAEVISVCDLTISAPYSATAIETIGARKKAIYYDVCGRNLGDYYFNQYPNFVAHDYEELKNLIKYWAKCDEKTFNKFLEGFKDFDEYLYCGAISRLRKMLMA